MAGRLPACVVDCGTGYGGSSGWGRLRPGTGGGGIITCYVKEADMKDVQVGMGITVDGEQGKVTEVGAVPVEATGGMDAWMLHLGGIAKGDWVYPIKARGPVSDGIYEVRITVESVSLASFIWN